MSTERCKDCRSFTTHGGTCLAGEEDTPEILMCGEFESFQKEEKGEDPIPQAPTPVATTPVVEEKKKRGPKPKVKQPSTPVESTPVPESTVGTIEATTDKAETPSQYAEMMSRLDTLEDMLWKDITKLCEKIDALTSRIEALESGTSEGIPTLTEPIRVELKDIAETIAETVIDLIATRLSNPRG